MAGAQKGPDEAITDINVTPLVDVSLVLVIIFMAISPFAMTSGIKVLESKAKAAIGKVSKSESVNIKLELSGKLTVNGKETNFEGLGLAVQKALGGKKDRLTILTADDKNKVGDVVRILDISKQFGAQKIAIMHSSKKKKKEKKG
ncbi:MAG: hypothetical protein COB53_08720 [Elusimicrobia bacterium]|nr:MAG: hypothetical protein COB53_08720 [Elusimicrobiota bacterium]